MTSERNREIVRLREAGQTLEEIGERFGITRERARQIAKAGGASAEATRAARADRGLVAAQRAESLLLDGFRSGRGVPEMANDLGLQQAAAREVLQGAVTSADRAERRRRGAQSRSAPRFSHADLTAAVGTVAARVGGAPTLGEYREVALELRLPSAATVVNRFGSWTEAVRSAGMVPRSAGRSQYVRRWTENACWDALRGLLAELGDMPTAQQYDVLASADPDLPSLATVRGRLGRWSEITTRLLDVPHQHPVLGRLGVSSRAHVGERDERVWLAHLAGDVSDEELVELLRSALFTWDASYGPRPDV